MVVYKLKCLTEGCDASYIGESKRICSVRMEDHESDPKSHVTNTISSLFTNVEILDRANTLELKS